MEADTDSRLTDLLDLNGYFPFTPSETPEAWAVRKKQLHQQLLVANGLWPMPESRPPVAATVHGRVQREGYTVDRVFFESSVRLLPAVWFLSNSLSVVLRVKSARRSKPPLPV